MAAIALVAPVMMAVTPLEAQSAPAAAPAPAPVRSISATDKAAGAKAHPQLLAEFGGPVTGPQADYVAGVGKTIAMQSGLGNARSDFTVTLLNSPVNNAFAIPGGYIYTTRQLVALMNNEAELAAVLGHEVGHVAARHSAKRQRTNTYGTVGGLAGVLLGAVVGGDIGNLIAKGTQVVAQGALASYSRGQETQADNLGVEYLRRAGYDPRAMSTVLQSLASQNALEARLMGTGGSSMPQWASTHPDPASRVRATLARAGANAAGRTNRDVFLNSINGLTYGDDPKQGIVEGRSFVHPDMRLAFQAPAGFVVVNGTQSVAISGQSGKGEFRTAAYNGDLDGYLRAAFASLTSQGQASISPASIQHTTVNGLPAAYGAARAQTSSGVLDVVVFAYELAQGQAVHFVTISQAGQAPAFDSMFGSMRRMTAAEAAAVHPRRLAVVTVKNGDTLQSLAARMAYSDAPLDRFLVLNGLTTSSRLAPGDKVKIVTN
jgi:predicted Zn-dependent protease